MCPRHRLQFAIETAAMRPTELCAIADLQLRGFPVLQGFWGVVLYGMSLGAAGALAISCLCCCCFLVMQVVHFNAMLYLPAPLPTRSTL